MSYVQLAGGLGREIAGNVIANSITGDGRTDPNFDASKVVLTPAGAENTIRSTKLENIIAHIIEGLGYDGSFMLGGFNNIQDRIRFDADIAADSMDRINRSFANREILRILAQNEADRALANVNKSWDRAINLDTGTAGMLNNAVTASSNVASTAMNANANMFNSGANYASGLARALSGVAPEEVM